MEPQNLAGLSCWAKTNFGDSRFLLLALRAAFAKVARKDRPFLCGQSGPAAFRWFRIRQKHLADSLQNTSYNNTERNLKKQTDPNLEDGQHRQNPITHTRQANNTSQQRKQLSVISTQTQTHQIHSRQQPQKKTKTQRRTKHNTQHKQQHKQHNAWTPRALGNRTRVFHVDLCREPRSLGSQRGSQPTCCL